MSREFEMLQRVTHWDEELMRKMFDAIGAFASHHYEANQPQRSIHSQPDDGCDE